MITEEKKKSEELDKKKRFPWFKLLVTVLLLVIICLLLLRTCTPEAESEPGTLERELAAELGLLPGMTKEEIQDRLNRKVAESMLNVSINPTPVFPDGSSPGNICIENIPGNNYAFTVTIVRSDTGDTLLTTGLIDPGYYVEYLPLDQDLPAGKYICVADFKAYDPETLEEIGSVGTELLVTIEN